MGQFRRPLFWIVFIIILILAVIGGVLVLDGDIPDKSPPEEIPDENMGDGEEIPPPPTYEQLAQGILEKMTLDEKVGQMFFVRCRKDTAIADIEKYSPGGYILFAVDIEGNTKESLKSKISSYQDASKIRLLIGVDEEGGDIVRVSKYPEFRAVPFHSPQSLYAEGGYQLIIDDTKEKDALLKSLGFNINLAPVCDVSVDPSDYIYERTFGKDAGTTAEYVRTVVETMNADGVGCALKHFPGYGNNADTHKGIAIDERSYDTFVNSDFIPFQAGIAAGAGSVLVSHNIVKCMDENLPASLSPAVHDILRTDLGFDGIVMTDDLKMDAIKEYIGDETSAVLAIKAGNDLILASDFDLQIPSVLAAIENGDITEARIDESVLKILAWKLRLGIIS
ncbi:MAG TPA: glycoside hydrolase family 3 N-terminal domain-containing protein [Anaerovoracaceae bacterium]|nr:glycoside hydrolase family 3 N-terminal domain-containing protein [Anaerovoracaceae bacterium]